MDKNLTIALAQINLIVGDIAGNTPKIIAAAIEARDQKQADLVAFHEQAISNYSPEDLLYHQDFCQKVAQALDTIARQTIGIDVLVGYPEAVHSKSKIRQSSNQIIRFNSAAYLRDGKIIANYRKQFLPNYAIFDEKRYFTACNKTCIVELEGMKLGIVICEDLWHPEPIAKAKRAGAEIIIAPNASPFSTKQFQLRLQALRQRTKESQLPIVYVHQLGGHDELLFDGNSLAINNDGEIAALLPHCEPAVHCIEVIKQAQACHIVKQEIAERLETEALIYQALVLGVKDYVSKNGFKRAVIGLSGGIDSALTLAIAVDALGKDAVNAIFMPSAYTSQLSYDAVQQQSKQLGVDCRIIDINPLMQSFKPTVESSLQQKLSAISDQNLQARIRGTLLMTISNQTNSLVLTTGNKSEMAVGYCTLYGDMVGAFAVLKDVYKTLVYRLANYRNQLSAAIPQMVIDRPPSAELAPGQLDQDSLPPYDILDQILEQYIEHNASIDSIVAQGFDRAVVKKVVTLLVHNEYKRRQSAPGTRITTKGFGRDWRYPITSNYI